MMQGRGEIGEAEALRRNRVRRQIIEEAWLGSPAWGLSILFEQVVRWFQHNVVSIGIFISWPKKGDGRERSIGRRVGVLSVDSPNRILVVGWARFDREDLRRLAGQGRRLRIRVFGWLRVCQDVEAPLAVRTLESVTVFGASRIPMGVREWLTEAGSSL